MLTDWISKFKRIWTRQIAKRQIHRSHCLLLFGGGGGAISIYWVVNHFQIKGHGSFWFRFLWSGTNSLRCTISEIRRELHVNLPSETPKLFMSPTSNHIAGFGSFVSSLILSETLYIVFSPDVWLERKIHVMCMTLHFQSSARWRHDRKWWRSL